MKNVVIFLAFCGLCFAMVPRQERAQKVEVAQPVMTTSSTAENSTESSSTIICASQTPCGWVIYSSFYRIIQQNITNTYCICEDGYVCIFDEDDTNALAYVHRCRKPTVHKPSEAENEADT